MLYRNARSTGLAPKFMNKNIVAVGDSITRGAGIATPWPSRLVTALSSSLVGNEGHDGAGWLYDFGGGSLTARQSAEVVPLSTGRPTLCLFAGRNDIALGGSSAATTYSAFEAYLAACVSAGYIVTDIAVGTALPGTDLNNTTRGTYNGLLVAGAGHYGYSIVRLDQDARIGLSGCQNDATYYQGDAIHPNDAGAQVIADLFNAIISAG